MNPLIEIVLTRGHKRPKYFAGTPEEVYKFWQRNRIIENKKKRPEANTEK